FENNQLTTVSFPNSLHSIGEYSFKGNELTNLVIPEGVTSIASSAFENNQLTTVNFPNSLFSIGESSFKDNELTNLVIPDNVWLIGTSAFESNPLTTVILLSDDLFLEYQAFKSDSPAATIIAFSPSSAKDYAAEYDHPFINLLAAGVQFTPNGASPGEAAETIVTIGATLPADFMTTLSYK